MVKKLECWQPCLWGTPHFDTPKFGQILSFFTLKISYVQLKRLKNLSFGTPGVGKTSQCLLDLVYFLNLPIPRI